MGTAGMIGVRLDGVDHFAAVSHDSYPRHLGHRVVEEVTAADLAGWRMAQRHQDRLVLDVGDAHPNDGSFMRDSLYCEFAYILNLDNETLEFYRGFQRQPHMLGRYNGLEPKQYKVGTYYPVALLHSFTIDSLRLAPAEVTVAEMYRLVDAESERQDAVEKAAETHAAEVRRSALAKIATIEQFTPDEAALVRRLLEESK